MYYHFVCLFVCLIDSVTGSCFFVFSSALKASAGYMAKSSIVEGRMSCYAVVCMYYKSHQPRAREREAM